MNDNHIREIVLSKKMLDLMVEYYLASYENFDFQAPFDDGPEDSIIKNQQ